MHTWPAAFSAFMASVRLEYFFEATAPRIAAPKSTDSLSRGSTIGQPVPKTNGLVLISSTHTWHCLKDHGVYCEWRKTSQ
jgi:hypothetical protein